MFCPNKKTTVMAVSADVLRPAVVSVHGKKKKNSEQTQREHPVAPPPTPQIPAVPKKTH